MSDLSRLVDTLGRTSGPALTWYGEERVELSGPVLARWLAKTANLLGGDLSPDLFGGVGPGSAGTLRLGLGATWQAAVWEVAARLSGWQVIDEGGADVCVVADARAAAEALDNGAAWVLAQDLGALSLSWRAGGLSAGVLDALTELAAQADALEVEPGDVGWPGEWGPAVEVPPGTRRLLTMGGADTGRSHLVGTLAGLWTSAGSAVVVDRGRRPDDVARIAEVERALAQ